jgi:hypothetical protein
VGFVLLPGHRYETVGEAPLIDGLSFGALIANTAFDSNAIIADLDGREPRSSSLSINVEPENCRRRRKMYKWRHLIENFFGKLKEFKRIAMRADKTDSSFTAINGLIDHPRARHLVSHVAQFGAELVFDRLALHPPMPRDRGASTL